jgi:pimeloyl-ACP methyl ester carboxylesterase
MKTIRDDDAHLGLKRSSYKFFFNQAEMDFQCRWLMGSQTFQGSEMGECLYAISQIEDGNPTTWGRAWINLAKHVEVRAEAALEKKHVVSAREAYLRTHRYYRAALFIMSAKDPLFLQTAAKQRACFQKAAALFYPPIEPIDVPFEGKTLQGYFWPVDSDKKKRKTIIMIGGGETFVEDCFFWTGPAAVKRGWNVIMADLPGQGLTPEDGFYVRPDMEVPMMAVVDYTLTRPEVDATRLAAAGISWGGYIVGRTAIYDKRLKACVANSPLWDMERAFACRPVVPDDATALAIVGQLAWRRGGFHPRMAKTLEERKKLYRPYKWDPSQVTCPVLCVSCTGEQSEIGDECREAYAMLPNPRKAHVHFTNEDGAESHCQGENLSLVNQVMYDWLDELLQ